MLILVILLCLPSALIFADAFANNLVVTSMGCMTDLSTDEIIMNEDVVPPEESDFPNMHLAVLDENDKPTEASTYDPTGDKTLQIAFVNPYSTSEFNEDLQFVVEVEPEGAAEFVGGGSVGCDHNKRVSGRLLSNQAAVVLQINDPTATLRLWSGWATGHNAVRLTHDLTLTPGEEEKSREDLEEDIEELEEEIREQEFQNSGQEKFLREEDMAKLDKLLDTEKQNRGKRNPLQKPEHVPDKLLDPTKKKKDFGIEIAAAKNAAGAGGDTKTMKEKLNDHQLDLDAKNANSKKKQPHKLAHHATNNRRDDPQNLGMYDDGTDDDLPAVVDNQEEYPGNDDFLPDEGDVDDADINGRAYSTKAHKPLKEPSGHYLGCAFFVACMGIFFMTFGKKRDKGRRDL